MHVSLCIVCIIGRCIITFIPLLITYIYLLEKNNNLAARSTQCSGVCIGFMIKRLWIQYAEGSSLDKTYFSLFRNYYFLEQSREEEDFPEIINSCHIQFIIYIYYAFTYCVFLARLGKKKSCAGQIAFLLSALLYSMSVMYSIYISVECILQNWSFLLTFIFCDMLILNCSTFLNLTKAQKAFIHVQPVWAQNKMSHKSVQFYSISERDAIVTYQTKDIF